MFLQRGHIGFLVRAVILLALLCAGPLATAQEDTLDIFHNHLELQEIVVTGLTGDSRLKDTPSPVTIISARELKARASSNIIDALAGEPGVSQISTGGGISKPVIRGLGYNRIVVVADGLRQEGQQWGDEHGIEIDGNAVHSVEIFKGPASLMYGSDALAGVILFHSDPVAAPGTFTADLSSEYQSNNGLVGYTLSHGGNQGGVVWNLRFSDKYAHAYRNKADGPVPGTQFSERAFSGLAGLNRSWGYTRLRLGYYHLVPGLAEGYEDGVLEGPVGYAREIPFQQVHHYKAVWDNTLRAGSGRIKALVGFQQNRRQEYEESADEAGLDFRLNTLNYNLKYQNDSWGAWKAAFGVGGMAQQSENQGDEFLIPAYRLLDAGVFATASRAWERLTLSGGLRYDLRALRSEELEDRFAPLERLFQGVTGSVGLVWQAAPEWNIRANAARGFRAPNLSELSSNGVHEGTVRYELGNAGLQPEFSLQGDLGTDFSSRYFSVQAAVFCNSIRNYIFAEKTGTQLTDEDGNLYDAYFYTSGDALLYGGEAHLDIHPFHSLHIGNTFSYVRGTADGKDLPMMPAPRLRSEVKYEISHDGRLFNNSYVAFNVLWVGKQDHFLPGTETATEAYTLIGLSAGTDLFIKGKRRATLTLLADNLTDRVYTDHLSRLKYVGIRNMGRNIALKLDIPLF